MPPSESETPSGSSLRSEAAGADLRGSRLLDLVAVMDRLRSPGGCPWDAAQTHQSLVPYLVEETFEAAEAIETGDRAAMVEELGDVLLQVVFHARMAQDDPDDPFDIDAVADGIIAKLVRRHPHVFAVPARDGTGEPAARVPARDGTGEPAARVPARDGAGESAATTGRREAASADQPGTGGSTPVGGSNSGEPSARQAQEWDAAAVQAGWEALKATEKSRASVFDGVPLALPALGRAQKVLGRLDGTGLAADALQVAEPGPSATAQERLGARLWELVAEAATDGIDPEAALRAHVRRVEDAARAAELKAPR